MKRSFTGPVWLMICFGLLELIYSYFGVLVLVQKVADVLGMGHVVLFVLGMLLWPLVLFGEAFAYWLIRKRNRAQLLSWTHAVIFCVAFVLNGLVGLVAILHLPLGAGLRTRQGRLVEGAIFWALVAVSHVAFVQVLVLAFRREPPLKRPGEESENLLDDVVL
jgi:hypothetical protein